MTTRIEFISSQGHSLAGLIDAPEGEPRAYALFAHCFTCNKDLPIAGRIGRELSREGIALVRFDFPGLGESEGRFVDSTFSTNVDDLLAVSEQMSHALGPCKLMIGHSFGGPAAIVAAAQLETVVAVAVVGSPFSPEHVSHFYAGAEFSEEDVISINVAGRRFEISREFARDVSTHHMEETIRNLGRPLAIFHSPVDQIVGIENAAQIYSAALHPKSFVSLDRADHLVSDAETTAYLGHVLSAWAQYYVG